MKIFIQYEFKTFIFNLYFSNIVAMGNFDLSKYPHVNAWFEKVKGEIPNYEGTCGEGAVGFGKLFNRALNKEK